MHTFPIPSVLHCIHFVGSGFGWQTRAIRDYEFDFCLDGEREMYIDDNHYKISKGALVFRKPGQVVTALGDYNTYMLNLDFSHKNSTPPEKYERIGHSPLQELCPLDVLDQIPEVFFPHHQEDIIALFKKLIGCSYPNPVRPELQRQYISEFLFLVLSDAMRHNLETQSSANAQESHIEKACRYINTHYAQPISAEDLARYLSLNKNYVIRLFKKELSTTPNQYIHTIRLFHAKVMLLQTQLPIQNVAMDCGFNTPSYFIKCFKTQFGQTPAEYRSAAKNAEI